MCVCVCVCVKASVMRRTEQNTTSSGLPLSETVLVPDLFCFVSLKSCSSALLCCYSRELSAVLWSEKGFLQKLPIWIKLAIPLASPLWDWRSSTYCSYCGSSVTFWLWMIQGKHPFVEDLKAGFYSEGGAATPWTVTQVFLNTFPSA